MKLAIIPACGGGKRILRKNIKPFFGKPPAKPPPRFSSNLILRPLWGWTSTSFCADRTSPRRS
ncbi:hypothetical protein [Aromatoleum anaerobium]|uniref:hypothetical protein n=1 Tax=Aromatoleum anaerobium TaxID=182180 RepID=UPI001B7D1091|nr:hypothetical protein [Aromatoleum anaerobium]MCK0505415.1 hypothetical protein [Aromatoleum anaerobium]